METRADKNFGGAKSSMNLKQQQQAGKPKHGLIFQNYYRDKSLYKKRLQEDKKTRNYEFYQRSA